MAALNEQIDMYFSKKISSDELGQWAKQHIMIYLKGDILKLINYTLILS